MISVELLPLLILSGVVDLRSLSLLPSLHYGTGRGLLHQDHPIIHRRGRKVIVVKGLVVLVVNGLLIRDRPEDKLVVGRGLGRAHLVLLASTWNHLGWICVILWGIIGLETPQIFNGENGRGENGLEKDNEKGEH